MYKGLKEAAEALWPRHRQTQTHKPMCEQLQWLYSQVQGVQDNLKVIISWPDSWSKPTQRVVYRPCRAKGARMGCVGNRTRRETGIAKLTCKKARELCQLESLELLSVDGFTENESEAQQS